MTTKPNEAIRNCSAKKKIIVTKAEKIIKRLVLDFRLANLFSAFAFCFIKSSTSCLVGFSIMNLIYVFLYKMDLCLDYPNSLTIYKTIHLFLNSLKNL